MTDNGPTHKSMAFAEALGAIRQLWTRPHRPRSIAKVESLNRTKFQG